MEDLLLQIIKESTGSKNATLKQAAQIAYDKLYRQHGIHRDPSHELRTVCLTALQMALETKRAKYVTMGLNGLHRIIKDERFYIGMEPEDDSLWLPAQLLRTTAGVTPSASSEDTVVNVLRLFLSMACSQTCTLNGRLLIEILSRCGECWETGSRAIRAASLAAASQCLRTFCSFLIDEAEEVQRTAPGGLITAAQASAVYNEVIPVMQWLCSRLIEPRVGSPKKAEACGSLFLTECILTLTTSLPRNVHTNPHFTSFLWQKFCPTLAAALGSPGRVNLDKKFTYKDALHLIENEARGFFTGPGLDGPQARCVYLTGIQLLRIAGAQGSLRPMLEALFHRILLLPSPQNRTEPLKCVREIFRSPERLVDLAVILHVDKYSGQGCSDDMAMFRLLIDAMEECAVAAQSGNCNETSLQASVECIVALLESLQTLCSGEINENTISDQAVDVINNRYSSLRDADYTGPLTYQSMARLPAPYRDAVAELRQNGFETSSGSESDNDHPEPDMASNGSGDTEGPEDENQSSSDECSSKVDNVWPYSHLEAPVIPTRSDTDYDRHHAKEFAKALKAELVPKLLRLRSCVEVDEAMQEFASAICQENSMNYSDFDYNLTAINADGIYLAIYSALLLTLQLMRAGYYENPDKDILIPLSEQQFVTSVQNTGVLVYLSTAWLCELYQAIIISNSLDLLNKEVYDSTRCALVDMLCDAGGYGSTQMLSEWQRLQSVVRFNEEQNERREAAKKLSRRLLTCCWDSMVTVLSTGLGDFLCTGTNRLVALSKRTLRVKIKTTKSNGEALYAMCLDGLHSAATLSNSLNLQHLAGKILNLLSSNVCQTSGPRISASQAMSMDVVLIGGLNLGSYSPECWHSVFSVCRHVTQLEHDLFSLQNPSITTSPTSGRRDYETGEKLLPAPGTGNDKLNLSSIPIDDDETCVDVYSFLQAPLQSPNTNVSSILKVYSGTNETVLLSQVDTSKVLCALSHQAENLFNDAAERLSLPSLCQFLKSLCRSSREQLYRSTSNRKGTRLWWPTRSWKKSDSLPLSLLLHRVGDVTLKVFRSSRPLLHILKVWAITGPHLMDAACHKDRAISKRAIEYIHDIITALLVEQSELPHFHFNEALLKPFENLLSMETSDVDVQDQIVACLYEIVEAHRTEIRSGWRPLFGTLRNARCRMLNIANLIDIFRVFLDSDNTLVFANAGLDCILCLLSYLEVSSSNGNTQTTNNTSASTTIPTTTTTNNHSTTTSPSLSSSSDDETNFRPMEFLHETLRFLERCSSILGFMYNMPKCPNFHSTYKIKGITYTHIIDANIPSSMENFTYFGNDYLQNKNEQHMISYRSLHIDKDTITKIDEMDKPSGVLKVWFLLLDGLTNSLIVCPISHQAPILQTIFKLFKNLTVSPGIDFGFYCINHLLIPMIQDWLRYINKTGTSWTSIEKNFKHCCCMTTDLVVEFIEKSQKRCSNELRKQNGMMKARLTTILRPVDNLKYSQIRLIGVGNIVEDSSSSDGGSSLNDGVNNDENYSIDSNNTNTNSNCNNTNRIINNNLLDSSSSDDNNFSESPTKIPASATLALKQLLLVLIECSAQAQETIARVGVSCLKHVILSTGHLFNESQWMIVCSAMHRACTVTIAPLRQLSFAFHEKSNSFYGDCANVKVAARRDSTMEELTRINALAQQVFMLDNQREPNTKNCGNNHNDPKHSNNDDRSYSFLLYPLNNGFSSNLDNFVIRIPYKNVVVGLLANQILLQLVAKLLLTRLKCVPSAVHICIFDNYTTTPTPDYELDFRSKEILLRCVKQYLTSSLEFDSRPGLKFLMQKVSNIDYAANLYKQMTSSWMIYFIALVDSYLNDIVVYNLGTEDLNYILESCSRLNTTTVKKKENFVRYLFCLQDAWNLVCELYLSHTANHDIENNGITKDDTTTATTTSPKTTTATTNGRIKTNQDTSVTSSPSSTSLKLCNNGDGSVCDMKISSSSESEKTNSNPPTGNNSPAKSSEEENITMTTLISEFQPKSRTNPFDTNRPQKQETEQISPEIEQQRASSILKDSNYKRAALAQLVVASMELLRSLPEEAADNLRLLMTPTIREAFRLVQLQSNEPKVNQF